MSVQAMPDTVAAAPRPITTVQKVALTVLRLALAYLFFTQLFWKLPPTFGCNAAFGITTGGVQNGRVTLQRTRGLCDWLGVESVWAKQERLFFTTNTDNQGRPEIFINLSFLTQLNGSIVDGVIIPNIRVFGWLIWFAEASIFVLLLLGLFSRLGGLIALGVSAQLMLGLAGIPNPYEWEWGYNNMVVLSLMVFAFAPGRFFGVDALLIPRLKRMAEKGNRIARVLLLATGQ